MKYFLLPVSCLLAVAAIGAERKLNAARLDESLKLGRQFLLANQRSRGNFNYEFKFHNLDRTQGDNVTRQAGALWGLSLLQLYASDAATEKAAKKGLSFFHGISKESAAGRRMIVYPGQRSSTGAVALVAMSIVELLRSDNNLTAREKEVYRNELAGYLKFLVSLRTRHGQFYSSYTKTGGSGDQPSPYFDGETLLCLIKAAKYAGHKELIPGIKDSAARMYEVNVKRALQADPDSATTKGFYQWGTMCFYELYTSEWKGTEIYGRRAVKLGHWMIDTHRILHRRRNTAYAFEGITHAYELARLTRDRKSMLKFARAADIGLAKLLSWQVGHSLQNGYIQKLKKVPPQSVGGVLNHASEPLLRIDVTQHQMHAVALARKFIYKDKMVVEKKAAVEEPPEEPEAEEKAPAEEPPAEPEVEKKAPAEEPPAEPEVEKKPE